MIWMIVWWIMQIHSKQSQLFKFYRLARENRKYKILDKIVEPIQEQNSTVLKLFRRTILLFTYELYDSLEGDRDFRLRNSRYSLESCISLPGSYPPLPLPFLERWAILPILDHPPFDIVSKIRNTTNRLVPPNARQPCCSLPSRCLNSLAGEALRSNNRINYHKRKVKFQYRTSFRDVQWWTKISAGTEFPYKIFCKFEKLTIAYTTFLQDTLFLPKRKILERINSRAVLQPIEREKQKFKFPIRNAHEVSTKHASLRSKTDVYLFFIPYIVYLTKTKTYIKNRVFYELSELYAIN